MRGPCPLSATSRTLAACKRLDLLPHCQQYSEKPNSGDTLMSEALIEKEISGGVVHDLPADLKKALTSDAKALETWGGHYAARAQ